MTELKFSRREIDDLAQKLDSLQSLLSPHEKDLLVAIFSAAKDKVRISQPKEPASPGVTAASLREQLLNAFIPGGGTEFTMNLPPIKIGPEKL